MYTSYSNTRRAVCYLTGDTASHQHSDEADLAAQLVHVDVQQQEENGQQQRGQAQRQEHAARHKPVIIQI